MCWLGNVDKIEPMIDAIHGPRRSRALVSPFGLPTCKLRLLLLLLLLLLLSLPSLPLPLQLLLLLLLLLSDALVPGHFFPDAVFFFDCVVAAERLG
jgi:hypothetical protein